MKLSTFAIFFCGEERYFKRCPTRELKNYQKEMEEIQEKLQPDLDKIEGIKDCLEELVEDYNDCEANISYLEGLKNTNSFTPKIVEDLFNLRSEKKNIRKKIKTQQKDLADLTKNMIENQDKANEEIIQAYDKLACKLIDKLQKGTFKDNYDSRDQVIAMHLGTIYSIYMSDKTEEEILKEVNNIIDNQLEKVSDASFQL